MRRLPSDSKYLSILPYTPRFVWCPCDVCGVEFTWEQGYSVITDRCLQFPTENERERRIIRKYPSKLKQALCPDCGAVLMGNIESPAAVLTHEEFDLAVDEFHKAAEPPEPRMGVRKRAGAMSALVPFTKKPAGG